MNDRRAHHLKQFYELLAQLERKVGGARRLSKCNGRMGWPRSGVYFFRETGEIRNELGDVPRVVRVGTHALKAGGKTTLWNRLSQHRGVASHGGGNHRGSVFREIVGAALIRRDGWDCPTWGQGNHAPKWIKEAERPLEQAVSGVIGAMPFLWLAVEDEPGPDSLRGCIERNAIALLSNYQRETIDLPSPQWLGSCADSEKVQQSGLWNSNHVDDNYDPAFLCALQRQIDKMGQAKYGQ